VSKHIRSFGNNSVRRLSPQRQAHLEKRLLTYALGAAGVVAVAQPATAAIVYTKANVTISQGVIPIDLDQDGKPDFKLHNYWVGSSSSVQAITIKGSPSNSAAAVIGHKRTIFEEAEAVPLNYSIGSGISKKFVNLKTNHAYIGGGITNEFLGLRFSINGETHYGWARITTKGHGFQFATVQLTGFAYETTPNTAILAGDRGPGAEKADVESVPRQSGPSLAMLGVGASGLNIWRRETGR
jgi:hypothetical protein